MKLNRLETHDRLEWFKKSQVELDNFIQKMHVEEPFGDRPYYIFTIKRTVGKDEKVALVQQGTYDSIENTPEAFLEISARLTRPEAAPNTTLTKIYPGKDYCKTIWNLPEPRYWDQYVSNTMFADDFITKSIFQYISNQKQMEAPERDDPQSMEEFNQLRARANGKNTFIKIPIFGAKA